VIARLLSCHGRVSTVSLLQMGDQGGERSLERSLWVHEPNPSRSISLTPCLGKVSDGIEFRVIGRDALHSVDK